MRNTGVIFMNNAVLVRHIKIDGASSGGDCYFAMFHAFFASKTETYTDYRLIPGNAIRFALIVLNG